MVNCNRHKYQIALLRITVFLAVLFLYPHALPAEELPFRPGEKLVYEGTWLGIVAGRVQAVVEEADIDGQKLLLFSLHAFTTNLLDKIWSADDYFNSYWDPEKKLPKKLEVIIRETNTKKDKTVDFDHSRNTAVVTINEREPEEKELDPKAQDFFSSGYFTRMHDLEVGQDITFPVFEDNENYDARIEVIKKERIPVLDGEIDTVLIKPILRLEGALQKRGRLWVWLTDDQYKTPVKIRLKVLFGSIYLKLIEAEGVDLKIIPVAEKKKK